MIPMIQKVNNPGRPVVSSVNSHTEKLAAYVDEFLGENAQENRAKRKIRGHS